MKIKSSQTLVQDALTQVKTISPTEALELSNKNQCNLIDIRDAIELQNLIFINLHNTNKSNHPFKFTLI